MKTYRIKFSIMICCLIALSLALNAVDAFGQKTSSAQNQDDTKKKEAVKKISSIYRKSTYHSRAIDTILVIAQKATKNFDTYVYLAGLASEFGYATGDLMKLAGYASKTKFETDYYKQLADQSMMKAGPGILDLAESISKQDTPDKTGIENSIQKLEATAKYKNIDEARVANKKELDKLFKQ